MMTQRMNYGLMNAYNRPAISFRAVPSAAAAVAAA